MTSDEIVAFLKRLEIREGHHMISLCLAYRMAIFELCQFLREERELEQDLGRDYKPRSERIRDSRTGRDPITDRNY